MACFKFIIHLTGWVSQTIFIMINSILFLCSIIGNSLVIYLVWHKSTLRSPTYLLMSFLAMSDLLTSLFGQSSYCISVAFLKDVTCTMDKVIACVHVTSCTSSILLLSLIARDRYLHVAKRHRYFNNTSNRFAVTASIICYLVGMIVASLFMFEDRTIRISSTFAFAALGSSSFIFICRKSRQISRIVQDHKRQMQANCRNASSLDKYASLRSNNFEKAVNRSIFSVIILFFASWTPVIILMIIFTVHNILNEPIADRYCIAFAWGSTASYVNGTLNPLIYSYRCDAIGREIRKIAAKIAGRNSIAPPSVQLNVQGKDTCKDNVERANETVIDST